MNTYLPSPFEIAITELNDYAIFMLDPSGYVVSWNEGVKEILGWDAPDWIGRTVDVLYSEADVAQGRPAWELEEATRAGKVEIDGWSSRKNGSLFFAAGSTTALKNEHGSIVGFLKVMRDRTAVHAARQQTRELLERERIARENLEQAQAEILALNATLEDRVAQRTVDLKSANDQLEMFSSSVAHDIRAPLRAIDGYACCMLEEESLSETGRNNLGSIRGKVAHTNEIIGALLELSHASVSALHSETIDVSGLAEQISTELAVPHELNPSITIARELTTIGDLRLMKILLFNLMRNAHKYSSRTKNPQIEVGSIKQSDGRVTFFVRDNGVGFDMNDARRLFQPFERLTSDFPGTGIGLATVKRIVDRHKGRIWAEGRIGLGATFWFEI